MRVAPIGTDPQDHWPLSGFRRPLEGTGRARANRFRTPRACAGLVNAVNWKRGRAGPDLALVAARLVDGGRGYGRRIDVRVVAAIAGTVGCELAVLIQKLASRATARGWLAGVIAGCASGCAEKLLPAGVRSSPDSATEALARARPGQEQR
jgi:hypothetical protein